MRKCKKCGNHEFAYEKHSGKANLAIIGLVGAGVSMWIPILGWVMILPFLLLALLAPIIGKTYYTGKCLKCGAVEIVDQEEAEQFQNENE